MSGISRREVLAVTGAVGLSGLATSLLAADDVKTPSVDQVLESIRITPEQDKQSPVVASPTFHPVVFIPNPNFSRRPTDNISVKGEVVSLRDKGGQILRSGLSFTCDPRYINSFGIAARKFSFSVTDINWQAGAGWPVYHTYCPNDDYGQDFYYRNAKRHQIVPSIKGQNYFVGCGSSAVCESANPGEICFAVNDNIYPDNMGYFVVEIWGYSN
jgi:hypothetical protein